MRTARVADASLRRLVVADCATAPVAAAATMSAAAQGSTRPVAEALSADQFLQREVQGSDHVQPAARSASARATSIIASPAACDGNSSGEDQELIVSDGKQLYNYEPDLNQVIETPLEQAFRSSSFAAFLLGIGNVQRDFNASLPALRRRATA